MGNRFNTSANIVRDENRKLDYVVTPNAKQVAADIGQAYRNGIHSFTIIGSYGTGKSSFLLAFLESLTSGKPLEVNIGFLPKRIETVRLVGQYTSLIQHFHELFDIVDDFDGNQKIFDYLFERARKNDLLVIYLDEFGKFLEYASKHNPDKELYFLQQLAEFANDHQREILLISTLHQSFEAYGSNMVLETQKREWKKVKGRFKELAFNEPVEQLLFLAAEKLKGHKVDAPLMAKLAMKKHLLGMNPKMLETIDTKLAPLDVISAGILARALQLYGQNERSLFTFLESDLTDKRWFNLPRIYDYLLSSFYSYLETSHNVHFRQWRAIMSGIDRIESSGMEHTELALAIFKSIALLQLFGYRGAHVDEETIRAYFESLAEKQIIDEALAALKGRRLITFANYNNSYKIIEGTDIDFDFELNQAEESVDRGFDLPSILEEHFKFSVIQAKEVSYSKGTPRLFTFHISTDVNEGLNPTGAFDGYINLVFNDKLKLKAIKEKSANIEKAILIAYYTNSKEIEDRVYEILKTKKVLNDVANDPVAKQEFMNILNSNERLLTHEVIGALYTNKVRWFFRGVEHEQIMGPKGLNKLLSLICKVCYSETPVFKNELLNKHKISASIHTARKNYFLQLASKWNQPELGFEPNRFPPEKTIYQTLLQVNGMHRQVDGQWELVKPTAENGFDKVWDVCKSFLDESRSEKRKITELWDILADRPFKLKLGLIDFWIPTFLFINRGDFALYEEDRFIPELNDSVMYLMTRQPHKYAIKSFEISDLRLRVFNTYREVLEQSSQKNISGANLIESLKPFLVFYKSLNAYAQQTVRLTEEAIALRAAIVNAQDLEQTFFESIPKALNLHQDLTASSDAKLAEFAIKLNDAIQELKLAYAELLNRFEAFICNEILGKRVDFEEYKKLLAKRYRAIKEHRLLPKQKVFVARLNSPLDDRDSWLASIAQALLGKPLDQIKDQEEEVMKDRLMHLIREMDNLQDLHHIKADEGEQVFKLDVTTDQGLKSQQVRISKNKQKEVEAVTDEIAKLLSKHKGISLAVLSKLLEKELK
jgi:hypothetical protein